MNINLTIKRHEKKLEKLNLKLHALEQSIKDLKKSFAKMNKPESRISTRKLSLIDRIEADNRLKNLMMPDFKIINELSLVYSCIRQLYSLSQN